MESSNFYWRPQKRFLVAFFQSQKLRNPSNDFYTKFGIERGQGEGIEAFGIFGKSVGGAGGSASSKKELPSMGG